MKSISIDRGGFRAKILVLIIFFLFLFALSGCGGDGGGIAPTSGGSASVGGLAAKGPFKSGATVEVYEINADGTLKNTPSWTGSASDDLGSFSIDLESYSGAVEVQVTGNYLNELTGDYDVASKDYPLKAVFNITAGESLTANVNLATTLAAEKGKKLIGEWSDPVSAIQKANFEIAKKLDLSGEDITLLDITDLAKESNAKLLLINAAVTNLAQGVTVSGGPGTLDPVKLIMAMADNYAATGNLQVSPNQTSQILKADDSTKLENLADKIEKNISTINVQTILDNLKKVKPDIEDGDVVDLTTIEISLSKVETTSSQGLFKIDDETQGKVSLAGEEVNQIAPLIGANIVVSKVAGDITTEVISPNYTYGSATTKTGDDMYLFVQKVDKNKVEVKAEELVCEECDEQLSVSGLTKSVLLNTKSTEKPVPKTISSSDGTTSVVITDMKLKKDITMAVTPYKSPLFVPQLNRIEEDIGNLSVIVVSGADINIVDSNGIPTTAVQACFCAKVQFMSTRIIGEMTGSEIYNKVTGGNGTLHLLVFKEKKWQIVDQPQVTINDQGGGTFALKQNMGKILRLYPFVFVFKPKAEDIFEGSISGIVKDKAGGSLKGVFVGLKGSDTYTITGDGGAFEIPYKSFKADEPATHILFFKKDGYLDATQPVQNLTSAAPDKTGIVVELEKIQNLFNLSGQVVEMIDNKPAGIGGALVTLHTPVVLDNITIDGTTITTGLDSAATYTWEIIVNGTVIYTESGTGEEGKNSFTIDSSAKAVMTEDGAYDLKVTVVHTVSGNTYTESQAGLILKDGATYTAVINPTSLYPSSITIKADGSGYYLFANLDQSMDGFLYLKGEATGYQPSDLIYLAAGQISANKLSKDITLTKQVVEEAEPGEEVVPGLYSEGFETEATDQKWTLENTSALVKWQVLSNPETVKVSEAIVDQILFPDRETVDVEGTIADITDSTATVSFTKQGETESTTVEVTLTDTNGDEKLDNIADNYVAKYYYESGMDTEVYDVYDVWLQSATEELTAGSSVMVSYPNPSNKEISLLPAIGGQNVLWYGYTGTGTISDKDSNTSTEANSGDAISPAIDLTNFSYATLNFKTWYEVESVDIAQGLYDQMKIFLAVVDDQIEEGGSTPIYDGNKFYPFTKGTYVELIELNPTEEPPGMQKPFLNYSSGGVNAIPVWVNQELNLNPFAGHKIRLKFSFDTKDPSFNGFRGWALDDIVINNEKSDLNFIVNMSSQPVQPAEDYLQSIRGNIATIMESTSPTEKSLARDTALSSLQAALALYPDNQELNMIQGVFKAYYLIYGNTDLNALIAKLGKTLDEEGEVLMSYTGEPFYPTDIVTYREYFNTDVLARIDECLAYLNKIESGTTSIITLSGQEYEADYSDVVLVKAWLKWAKGIINWALAYDWNVDEINLSLLTDLIKENDPSDKTLLEANTNLFTFASGYQTYLDKAKAALIEAIDDLKSTIDLTIAETDDQSNDIFVLDNLKDTKEAEYFKTTLSDIKDSLTSEEWTIHTYDFIDVWGSQQVVEKGGVSYLQTTCDIWEETATCNLAKIFDGSISLRDLIPETYDSYDDTLFTDVWLTTSPVKSIFPDAYLGDFDSIEISQPETKLAGESFDYLEPYLGP